MGRAPAVPRRPADVLATTSADVLLYAAMDGWRRQMVEHGEAMLETTLALVRRTRAAIDEIPGMHVLHDELLGTEASHELDPLHVFIDVEALGISGYQAADWLRAERRVDIHTSDPTRIEALLSMADDDSTVERLLDALRALAEAAPTLPRPEPVERPTPPQLELENVMLPRDAFFGPVEDVPAREAIGRIAAEQITPYPPGIPVILPGERITEAVVDYLEAGVAATMVIPDAADGSLETIRVVAI